jgi:hypothetical protein
MNDIKKIINQLNLGILPDELNFTIQPPDDIDWSKVQYNTFYKSKEYILGKMPCPEGFMKLPGANVIIEDILSTVKTPLEEMIERESIKNELKSNNTNIDELSETNSEQSST